ncbi:MAG: radical SAM protein, partial [Candidatus Methylomirabilales bacterium]
FEGQLRPAEIVDQVAEMRRVSGLPPTNIVYMGMGEPLLNFPSAAASIEVLHGHAGLGLGSRRITVSTVGVPERIVELGRRFPQVKLALSLHAARDDLRSELIPLNRRFPLRPVLEAVREHRRITGKLPTFEYVLLPGVTDAPADARALGEVLRGLPSRINLIEYNPFPEAGYQKPAVARMVEFRRRVQEGFPGPVTIRRSRGEDIHGGCGQLSLAAGR